MEIKNFLYFSKKISGLFLVLLFVGCASQPVQEPQSADQSPNQKIPEALRPPEAPAPMVSLPPVEPPPTPTPRSENPRIGLILGPGAARAMAHIGVVQELTKARLPISHVVGIEMGALVGAIYAQKAQPFDVEWQFSKFKDLRSLTSFLQGVFGSIKTDEFRLPFACPAFNLVKSQYFMMNKGVVTQMLPYCLPVPPSLRPHNSNVAALTEVKAAVDYLKARGANFIVYVHLLASKEGVLTGGLETESNFLWTLTSVSISKQWQAVDYVITVPVQEYDLNDWSHRRELVQKGLEAGVNASSQLSRRLGL